MTGPTKHPSKENGWGAVALACGEWFVCPSARVQRTVGGDGLGYGGQRPQYMGVRRGPFVKSVAAEQGVRYKCVVEKGSLRRSGATEGAPGLRNQHQIEKNQGAGKDQCST